VACGSSGKPAQTSPAGLAVVELRYEGGSLSVEVASTVEQRAVGLSNRDSLDANAGMIFDLGDTRVPAFWMKDTRIPLDMVWVREDGTVASVTADVQPQPGVPDADLASYSPAEPVRYVVELNAGTAKRLGIDSGDRLRFELP
jgi:hypothetical protein